MVRQLPVRNTIAYSFVTELEGEDYLFSFTRNDGIEGEEFYSMSIFDSLENVIVRGIKVVLGYDLLVPYSYPQLPPGGIIATNLIGNIDRVDVNEFGNSIKLLYVSEEEIQTGSPEGF